MASTSKDLVVAVLGCGFMGTALLKGIIAATQNSENRIKKYIAAVQRPESAKRLEGAFAGCGADVEIVCKDNVRAVSTANVVLLGFQPGDVKSILDDRKISEALHDKLIISMLAGVSCEAINNTLKSASEHDSKSDFRITRVVPSIGAQINESTSLVAESKLGKDDNATVQWLFEKVGTAEMVPEELLNAAVAISSTCHALMVTAVDAIVDGSVSRGIPRSTAIRIAAQCFRGASSILLEKMTPEQLKDSMSVPRGITTEAWVHLDAGNVRGALSQTVRQAVDYAERMA